MGAIRGSISYTKFYVVGSLPDDFQKVFANAILARVIEPMTYDSDDEQHHGWCMVDKPFELTFDHSTLFANEYLNLGLRVDRWRLQVPLLKAKIEEAEANYRAKTQRTRLGKQQRAEIKLTVVRHLRKQTIPVTKSYDLSWNTTEKVLRFWSKSTKVLDLFQDLFEKTFKVKLLQESPVATAMSIGLTNEQRGVLTAIEPTLFSSLSPPATIEPTAYNSDATVADLIYSHRFLGSEFLVWLWFESENNDGNFDVGEVGPFTLWLENAITLESDAVVKEQSKLKGASPSATQEAREALRRGKIPALARIRLEQGPHQFACMLTAATMGMTSVTIPALLKDDPEEKFYERMYLVEHLESYIKALFVEFLKTRLSHTWATQVVPSITKWVWDGSNSKDKAGRLK